MAGLAIWALSLCLLLVLAKHEHAHDHEHDHEHGRERVCVLGAGRLGSAIVVALARDHHDVHVWNRNALKAVALEEHEHHVVAHASPQSVVGQCEVIFTALATDDVALLKGLHFQPFHIWIGMGQSTPRTAREMAALAADKNIEFVDAALLGPTSGIGTRDAVLLVSGDAPVLQAIATLMAKLGTVRVVGPSTHASVARTALQFYEHACTLAFVQAVALAQHAGTSVGATDLAEMLELATPSLLRTQRAIARSVGAGEGVAFDGPPVRRMLDELAAIASYAATEANTRPRLVDALLRLLRTADAARGPTDWLRTVFASTARKDEL